MGEVRRVVINACFGGFSLSPAAVRRIAEIDGRPCYFFTKPLLGGGRGFGPYTPCSEAEAAEAFVWYAFDIPNPEEVLRDLEPAEWHAATPEEREAHNAVHEAHELDSRDIARDDPRLIQVVEELGGEHRQGASGSCAELRIVEIPRGVDWCIEEYDGSEHVAETHRTWR